MSLETDTDDTTFAPHKLKPEVKEAWCNALESGEYQQRQHKLKTGGGFCCLGVLTDLAVKDGVGRWTADEHFTYTAEPFGRTESEYLALPEAVKVWAGLKPYSQVGVAVPKHEREGISLADVNDSGNYTFKEIAALIREQL